MYKLLAVHPVGEQPVVVREDEYRVVTADCKSRTPREIDVPHNDRADHLFKSFNRLAYVWRGWNDDKSIRWIDHESWLASVSLGDHAVASMPRHDGF